jgi:hypothetical protein
MTTISANVNTAPAVDLRSTLTTLVQQNRPMVFNALTGLTAWAIGALPIPAFAKALTSSAIGGVIGTIAQAGTTPWPIGASVEAGPIKVGASVGSKSSS